MSVAMVCEPCHRALFGADADKVEETCMGCIFGKCARCGTRIGQSPDGKAPYVSYRQAKGTRARIEAEKAAGTAPPFDETPLPSVGPTTIGSGVPYGLKLGDDPPPSIDQSPAEPDSDEALQAVAEEIIPLVIDGPTPMGSTCRVLREFARRIREHERDLRSERPTRPDLRPLPEKP